MNGEDRSERVMGRGPLGCPPTRVGASMESGAIGLLTGRRACRGRRDRRRALRPRGSARQVSVKDARQWGAIVVWYAAFGLILAPYRLVRRGSRKRKREGRMHEETLRAIRESQQRPPDQP